MYRAFFGFREKPFNLTPDPKFLYLNASYREALAALHYGIVDRKGFVSLIGEAGTGKTTLLRRLLSELPRETRSVLVINPAIGFEEMLRFILSDLGRPPAAGATKLDMLEALNAELLDSLARGGNVVVLIDEAQDLTIPVLEELRLLSNLETAKEKILQLVLAGQPEFDGLLARPEIRQLRQRISVRARLRPLVRSEVEAYVGARIKAAGGDVRGLFTRGALFRLWWFSGGVPRLVNAACDNALVNAYAAGRRTIGWRDVGEAMRDLRGQVTWVPGRVGQLATLLTAALIGGGLMLGGLSLVRERSAPATPMSPVPMSLAPQTSPSASVGAIAAALVPATAVATPVPVEPTPTSTASPVPGPTESPMPSPVGPGAAPVAGASPRDALPAATPSSPDVAATLGVTATAAATLLPSPSPEPTTIMPQAREGSERRIRVAEGDTLTDLAQRHYGSAGPRVLAMIRAANPWVNDPDVLWVGRTLILPELGDEGRDANAGVGAP